jgi:hypothetical protein
MRPRRTLLALAVALAALPALPARANPDTPPQGVPCTANSAADRNDERAALGSVTGGPLTWTDPAGNPVWFTLTCTIQIGGGGIHSDPDEVSVSDEGDGLALLGATVSFRNHKRIYVCTSVVQAGWPARYLDAPTGNWLPDPAAARCGRGTGTFVTPPPTGLYGPVVGGIQITRTTAETNPVVVLHGNLANPALFYCPVLGLDPTAPYTVTCWRNPSAPAPFSCGVLYADAFSASPDGRVRASMDCDSDGTPEARTFVVEGTGGNDREWAVPSVPVVAFSCTADDGAGGPLRADSNAFCGSPA